MLDVDTALFGPEAVARLLARERRGGELEVNVSQQMLESLLAEAVSRSASDLHLAPGYPPTLRIHGALEPIARPRLTTSDTRAIVETIVPARVRPKLEELKNYDCSITLGEGEGLQRFRANLFLSQGAWCATLRHIPDQIPSFDWLGFPEALADRLAAYRDGLVIFSGVTGSGKTSTLAALVQLIRSDPRRRIITIEEPIEFVHAPNGSMVTQREVGRDVESFASGLKYGLRQDPDVILVGEIRDRETAQMALSAAETGHLILTTLHTRDAKGALTRLVDLFPQGQQDDVRSQLALSLRSVVCQHLIPAADPASKRVLAMEVLHNTMAVQVSIRTGRIETIESAIQTGKRDGMSMLDEDLQRLVQRGAITLETGRQYAKNPEQITATRPAW
jgi:twitching motility protein PilT